MDIAVESGRRMRFPIQASTGKQGYQRVGIVGVDTETRSDGSPQLFTFWSDLGCRYIDYLRVDGRNAASAFVNWLHDRMLKREELVLYAHNLKFDIPSLFYDKAPMLVARLDRQFSFEVGDWTCSGVYGGPNYVLLEGPQRRKALLVDSFSWFNQSLAKAADLVCPHIPKLDAPADLTRDIQTDEDLQRVLPYAMRDAEIAFHLGKAVDTWHEHDDLPQAISVADMAAKLFKRGYLNHDIHPQYYGWEDSLKSYHGGKNWLRPGGVGWHRGITSVDLKSAHPAGMLLLPSFSNRKAFRPQQTRFSRSTREFPRFSTCRVSGIAAMEGPPAIFDHRFKPVRGPFTRLCINGIELNAALRHGLVKLTKVYDVSYYDEDQDTVRETGFQRYVHDLYAKKEQKGVDPILRTYYKLMLNSLYGKTIQTTERERMVGEKATLVREAGGLFHPLIASSITANTRAMLLDIEMRCDGIHSSTDGVLCPDKSVNGFPWAPKTGPGSIEVEYSGATACILRNKTYQTWVPGPKTDPNASRYYRGLVYKKVACHGIPSRKPHEMEYMIATGERDIVVEKPRTVREAVRDGLRVNEFRKVVVRLEVGEIPGVEPTRRAMPL